MVWYGMVWYGMVWHGILWYGMVWYGLVWCGAVRCGVVWYGMAWHGMVWCSVGWCSMVWYGTGMLWMMLSYVFVFSLDLDTTVTTRLRSTAKPTTPYTHEPVTPLVTSIVPYQPVDISCDMFQPHMEVTLWQESSPGTLVRRIPDGVALILQGNVFTLTQGRGTDVGTYYCQTSGSRKVPSVFLTFTAGKFEHEKQY